MSTAVSRGQTSRIGSRRVRPQQANGGSACAAEGVPSGVAGRSRRSPVPGWLGAGARSTKSGMPGRRPRRAVTVLVALLFSAATCAFAVSGATARADHDRVFVSVALPQAASRAPWAEERDAFAAQLAQAFRLEPSVAEEFAGWILEASTRQALPPELLASLVMTESSFRKDVRSAMGAVGPGQVRPDLWGAWCGANLADPEENIDCAARILAHYVEVCAQSATEAEACALRSYNVGYRNRNDRHFAAAAARYVAKIQRYLADFRSA